MIFMKKLKFSSQSRVIGVRGQQVLLENILTLYIVLVLFPTDTNVKVVKFKHKREVGFKCNRQEKIKSGKIFAVSQGMSKAVFAYM